MVSLAEFRIWFKLPTTPILLYGFSQDQAQQLAWLDAGADDYLANPLDSREVTARLNVHLRMARLRKQTNRELRESEERFRSLFENSPAGIYRTTPDGQILLANPTLLRMLGYSSFEELASMNLERNGFITEFSSRIQVIA